MKYDGVACKLPRFSVTASFMRILAFDTAADRCDACILDTDADAVLAKVELTLGRGHAEHLVGVIDSALRKARLAYGDLDRIAVTTGPGSFTGVRVGVSAARGFALALNIPAIGVSTLEGVAAEVRAEYPNREILVAIDARRGEVYTQCFSSGGLPASGPQAAEAVSLGWLTSRPGTVLAGSGAGIVAVEVGFSGDIANTRASADVVTVAKIAALAKPPFDKPKPLYLRKPDARVQSGFAVARSGS